jgi:hypothetical protein
LFIMMTGSTPAQKLVHYLGYRNDPAKWAAYLERKRDQRKGLRPTTPLKTLPLPGGILGFQGVPEGHEIAFWFSDDGQPSAGLKNVATGKIVGPLPNAMLKEISEFGMKYRARTLALCPKRKEIDRTQEKSLRSYDDDAQSGNL